MVKNNFKFTPKTVTALTFGVAVFAFFHLLASRWNVDSYDEGALFPTNVGFAEGKHIFSEVSQQYGFITALINGPFIKIFGNYLIVSRIVGTFVIILTALASFSLFKKFSSVKVSLYATVLYLCTGPSWAWLNNSPKMSGGAWPNSYAMLLLLISFLLFGKSTNSKLSYVYVFFSAFFCAISSQARMEFFAVWVLNAMILLYLHWRKKISGSVLLFWIMGSMFAYLAVTIFLVSTGSLTDWYNQTITVWLQPNLPGVPRISFGFFVYNIIYFSLLAIYGLALIALNNKLLSIRASYFKIIVTNVSILFFLGRFATSLPNFSFRDIKIEELIQNVLYRGLFSYVNICVLSSIYAIFIFFKRDHILPRAEKINFQGMEVLPYLLATSCVGLLAVSHNFHADYTWMVVPPSIVFILSQRINFKDHKFNFSINILSSIKLYVVSIVCVSILVFSIQVQENRFGYEFNMFKGMVASTQDLAKIADDNFFAVNKFAKKEHLWMICNSGLLSTNLLGYLGADKWTWNQYPVAWVGKRPGLAKSGDSLLVCNTSQLEYDIISEREIRGEMTLVFDNGVIKIYKVN